MMHAADPGNGVVDRDIAEQLSPVLHGSVRGDDRRRFLVEAHDHLRELIAGAWQVACAGTDRRSRDSSAAFICARYLLISPSSRLVDLLDQHGCLTPIEHACSQRCTASCASALPNVALAHSGWPG